MKHKIVGIIPSRYNSSRFYGKATALINGIPLIARVYLGAKRSKLLTDLYVATDDLRIHKVCDDFKIPVIMTSPECKNGTERVYEAGQKIAAKYYINIQGDEPLVEGSDIDYLIQSLLDYPAYDVITLLAKIHNNDELVNSNIVKVKYDIVNRINEFYRETEEDDRVNYKHVGIYACRKEAIEKFFFSPQSSNEIKYNLEQYRFLDMSYKMLAVKTNNIYKSVDIPEDIKTVENILNGKRTY